MPVSRGRAVASWILQLLVAGILLQTLFFKFSGAEESVYIFTTVGDKVPALGFLLGEPWGRLGSGVAELVAGILLLIPSLAVFGALLSMAVIAGAIVSHLTILGIEVMGDGGLLFYLALIVFAGSAGIVYLRRAELQPILARVGVVARS
jgi:uncharacterized membrane protein YphA (DoxX/SURF4 family)